MIAWDRGLRFTPLGGARGLKFPPLVSNPESTLVSEEELLSGRVIESSMGVALNVQGL